MVVADEFVTVDGDWVLDRAGFANADGELAMPLLVDALRSRADNARSRQAATIVGDREIPYQLLKRILASCAQANFVEVALAVNGLQTPIVPDVQL